MPEFRLILYRGKFATEWYEGSRRFRRSLGSSDRKEAARLLDRFARDYEARQRPDRITCAYAWDEYRKTLGERPAGVTMGFERRAVIDGYFGEIFADDVTEEDCAGYAAERRALGKSNGTIWTELGHLRSALKWAEKKNLIVKAPVITRPERPEPRDKRLTRAQFHKFLAACDLPHVRLFVTLAMTTGARMRAILGLKWNRVDFEHNIIVLHDPERARTNKTRATVPMNRTARKALLEAREGATTDYVISWGGHKVGSVKKALWNAGKRSGLPWVTAHVFRHSAACMMAEDGVPIGEIAKFLGHADSRLTERVYIKYTPSYLQKAAGSLEFPDD